jgi:hypothetical protein
MIKLGEIDFIIENSKTHEIIHLEFTKILLFDPEVLSKPELLDGTKQK